MIRRPNSFARLCLVIEVGGALCARTLSPGSVAADLQSAVPPGADLFAPGVIPRLRIELEPRAVENLRQKPREFVAGKLFEESRVYAQVGVHLKGSLGSFRPVDDKPSLTLDFGRFSEGRKFHGLRRIHLNNSVEDLSLANEKLGRELFEAAGVPAPRVTRARLVLNGRDLGLYVLKEGFTEDFLACHFKRVGGELYEPVDGSDLDGRLKRNSVLAPVEPKGELKSLAEAALEPDHTRRWQQFGSLLDTDRFLKFMALEVMLGHRDGYCLARNNFRVYRDLDTGKLVFFPHGMDQLLGTAELPWQPHMAGLLARAILETPEGRQRYAASFNCLFTNLFRAAALTSRVDELTLELRPCVTDREWAGLKTEAAVVKERIAQRQLNLQAQLSSPPLKPLEFRAGAERLEGWVIGDTPAKGSLERVKASGERPALHIMAGPDTAASWVARALLKRGRYRFEGRGQVAGVQPLPYGIHQGAGLRIGGSRRTGSSLTGTCTWQCLAAEFEVTDPSREVEFICELRAQAGEAWFELESLRVVPLIKP